jgi:predicted nucleotide-binding protein
MSEDIKIKVGFDVNGNEVRKGAQTIAQETQRAANQYMGSLAQNASRVNNTSAPALTRAMGYNMGEFQTASNNLFNTMNLLKSKVFLVSGSILAAVAAFEKLDHYIKHTMFGTDRIVRESYILEDRRLAVLPSCGLNWITCRNS